MNQYHPPRFGVEDELDTRANKEAHPSLVRLGNSKHSATNPDYYHYDGFGAGVTFARELFDSPEAQQIQERVQRALTVSALEDMEDAWSRDSVLLNSKYPASDTRKPEAMGSLWAVGEARPGDEVEEGDVRTGYQFYVGSSMKQRRKKPPSVVLEDSLWEDLIYENSPDGMPVHRRFFRCAEPGLISEQRYANPEHYEDAEEDGNADASRGHDGGQVFVYGFPKSDEARVGDYFPPCGHPPEYGCVDLCRAVGVRDLDEGFVFEDDDLAPRGAVEEFAEDDLHMKHTWIGEQEMHSENNASGDHAVEEHEHALNTGGYDENGNYIPAVSELNIHDHENNDSYPKIDPGSNLDGHEGGENHTDEELANYPYDSDGEEDYVDAELGEDLDLREGDSDYVDANDGSDLDGYEGLERREEFGIAGGSVTAEYGEDFVDAEAGMELVEYEVDEIFEDMEVGV